LTKNSDINDFFKTLSINEGFDDIGFASAELLKDEYEHFLEWVSEGYNADMGWLERKQGKRRDVSLLLNGARSVIVFLHNYYTDNSHSGPGNRGKISRYAWGNDYHKIIRKKLISFSRKAKEKFPSNHFKPYVDTGPVLEKQWAVRAGVGWQGKNSLLLNKKFGSYCFIGLIITDLSITPNKKINNYCGSCTACIDACPTSAIVSDFIVDSGKCISYWTIESDREKKFPDSIKKNLNGWIFGCDICQEVCPWNSKKKIADFSDYQPRYGETDVELQLILEMNDKDFSNRFRNTNLKRSKLTGLQRNARELLEIQT